MSRTTQLLAFLLVVAAVNARPGNNDIEDVSTKPHLAGSIKSVNTKTTTKKPEAPAETEKAVNEKFPYAVLFGGTCGGTIISPTWVLTAGHCTINSAGRYVLAGTNNTDNGSGVYRRVKRLVIHPLFSVGPYWLNANQFNITQVAAYHDFLLAELAEPLPLDGKTIAAATLNDEASLPVGLEVGFGGFGTDHFGGTMRSEMHEMEYALQDDETCKTMKQYNPAQMLCTKGVPPRFDSACSGDSGSGLVDKNGRVLGVMSWGEDDALNCRNEALVVFSRVSAVRDWIRQVTDL